MKKILYILPILFGSVTISSCVDLVDDINNNPNSVTITDVDAGLYLNTPELASVDIQRGLFSRLCALWSGQLVGVNQTPLSHYNYLISESTFSFGGYQSVITQDKFIREQAPDNKFYQGVTRILDALLFGTYASFYGDVPCSEVSSDVESPKFEAQADVFSYSQNLLDEAITYLKAEKTPQFRQDYLLNGSVTKWIENAYTLKARFYLLTKEYDKAYESALNGVSSDDNSIYFYPVNDKLTDNKNNYYEQGTITQGFGTYDLQGKQNFLFDIIDSRNNAKTDETARKAYYSIEPADVVNNHGIASKIEKEPIITYSENLLILAEAGARIKGFATGLSNLNKLRSFLNDGGCSNDYYGTLSHKYEAYDEADFANGGLLNNGLTPIRALLKEIITERYVTGFTTFMPFDDARRLRGTGETDIAVDIPLNTTSASAQPERFFYPEEEMQSNVNAPKDPGLYQPTPINTK
jgi:hypothetical protein